ncbi:hypothetical protein D3C75_1336590 [compost metagenome]
MLGLYYLGSCCSDKVLAAVVAFVIEDQESWLDPTVFLSGSGYLRDQGFEELGLARPKVAHHTDV